MSTEGCKHFAVEQSSLLSVSFLPLLVQTLWPEVSFCFFGLIQISLFYFLHLSQLCTACLLFVPATESSVLNVLFASGTRLVMADDCIFIF